MLASYEWGCRVWGITGANKWLRDFRRTIFRRLDTLPMSCALAPESEDLDTEVRQLIIDRYRVLFMISGKKVTILYVRGPYVEDENNEIDI